MTPLQIRRWRPTRFRDFVGARNGRAIARLRRNLISNGRLPTPLLLVAPYGYGKTSLARLLLLRLDCRNPDTKTGDPCGACDQCVGFTPANEGTGSPYLRREIDCTHAGRPQIIRLCHRYRLDAHAALFLDELHRLHERNCQEALLKFSEDFPGVLIAAVMADRYGELIPPLRERFETVWLDPPTEDEVVKFLAQKCSGDWRILAEEPVIRAMVHASGVSFRICLKVLAEAAGRDPRRLDHSLVDEFLGGGPDTPPVSPDVGPEPEGEIEDDEQFLE